MQKLDEENLQQHIARAAIVTIAHFDCSKITCQNCVFHSDDSITVNGAERHCISNILKDLYA